WVGEMIDAVLDNSLRVGEVRMDDETLAVMHELRAFMFERVYLAPSLLREQRAAIDTLSALVDHHLVHPDQIPATYREADAPLVTQVADYVAGMTDRYALAAQERIARGR
ncbi:MAG TPA: deoxyguanosinetriphosphate triphosphohydrolase, partial [Candidatus Limnocylindria bacterium]